ncbi:MAG: serine/threonine-protein kinase [Acidimicrobiales bacterium]
MTPLRTKRYIGGYRVIAPIGAGGFATVYRAINEATGQEVAIKVLAENHSLVADTRRRFLEEIDLLRTVDSQAIAQIYEVGETETDQPFMVLELADRGDLRRRLEEIRSSHQVLSRAELALLAHHLYDSLTTLHRAEIVHRDVSPGNILIRSHQNTPNTKQPKSDGSVALLEPGERLLLADLGHAKDMIRASGFTAGGGTRGFTSPEQRDDITVVDLRADIFSATAVIEWAAHDGEYAEILEPFFDVGLAEDPADRFTSMTEWHAAFSASLSAGSDEDTGGPLALGSMVDFAKGQAPSVNRRAISVAVAALALGGMAAFVLTQLNTPNEIGNGTTVAGVRADVNPDIDDGADGSLNSGPTLVVKATDEDLLPASPTAPLIQTSDADGTVPGSPTSNPSSTSQGPSTTAESASTTVSVTTTSTSTSTSTTEASTTSTAPTTTEQPGGGTDPSADILEPADGGRIRNEMSIAGVAEGLAPEGLVRVAVVNSSTDLYWNAEEEQFQPEPVRFDVKVEQDEDDSLPGTWEYTIPAERLESGLYYIRVWASDADDNLPLGSDTHAVEVR